MLVMPAALMPSYTVFELSYETVIRQRAFIVRMGYSNRDLLLHVHDESGSKTPVHTMPNIASGIR